MVTNIMSWYSGGQLQLQHIPVQLDTVNIPWNMEVSGMVPTDWYDIYCDIASLAVGRSDYFIDEASGTKYNVFGNPAPYLDHLEVRVSKPSGNTP